jgi:uncharacterized protein (TIGR00297 family)
VTGRVAVGLALAAAIALAARRARSLSSSGAAAATLVGTLCVAAGWRWGALLIAFFVTSSALSRFGAAEKERRTGGVVAKGGARDATQVLANGGVFACAAVLWIGSAWDGWVALGAGSLAAAAADTWGTEVGTLYGRRPRLVSTWREVEPGTSGAVTLPGLAASIAGALFVAAAARGARLPAPVPAIAAGGIAGALVDSLVGALFQGRRRCARCGVTTERATHSCGALTEPAGGFAWLDNDVVNVICAVAGGAVTLLLSRPLRAAPGF